MFVLSTVDVRGWGTRLVPKEVGPVPIPRRFWKEVVAKWHFYLQWLKHTVAHWGHVSSIATALGIFIPLLARISPTVGSRMGPLAWEIPIAIFAVLALLRFFLAPYWMYREKEEQALRFSVESEVNQREITQLKRQREILQVELQNKPPEEPEPEIQLEVTKGPVHHVMNDVWNAGPSKGPFVNANWPTAVIAIISNPPALRGKRAITAYNLAVSATFRDLRGNSLGKISKTYWLGHSVNNVSLAAGEFQHALIATYSEGQLLALWMNPRTEVQRIRTARQFTNTFSQQGSAPTVIKFDQDAISLDLTVICVDTGQTLAQGEVRLAKDETNELKIERA